VVKDLVDPTIDESLAKFVVNSHFKNHPNYKFENFEDEENFNKNEEKLNEDIIPQELLKKYLLYAKQNYSPKLQNIDSERLIKFYTELRKESFLGGTLK
jgi:DNA replication licensing factor MCM2